MKTQSLKVSKLIYNADVRFLKNTVLKKILPESACMQNKQKSTYYKIKQFTLVK